MSKKPRRHKAQMLEKVSRKKVSQRQTTFLAKSSVLKASRSTYTASDSNFSNSSVCLLPGVSYWTDASGLVYILPAQSDDVLRIDGLAALMWMSLIGRPVNAAIDSVVSRFGIRRAVLERDVLKLISHFRRLEIIQMRETI